MSTIRIIAAMGLAALITFGAYGTFTGEAYATAATIYFMQIIIYHLWDIRDLLAKGDGEK